MLKTLDVQKDDYIKDPSLVLDLPLYRLDGSKFTSADKHGHLCTNTGAPWRLDGRLFDGDDVITIPNTASLNITGTVTVEAWIKSDVGQATSRSIVIQTGGSPFYFYGLRFVQTGEPAKQKYRFTAVIGGVSKVIHADDEYPANTWTHLLGLYDGAELALYVDVVKQAETAAVVGAMGVGNNDFTIGAWQTSEFFEGTIGEVRIYNRALSILEIRRNHLATKWRYR